MIFYIFCNDCPGSNQSPLANCVAANNGSISSNTCAFFDEGLLIGCVSLWIFSPRCQIIREYTRRTTKNVVLKFYPFINGYIVLNFDTVANVDIIGDVYILSK